METKFTGFKDIPLLAVANIVNKYSSHGLVVSPSWCCHLLILYNLVYRVISCYSMLGCAGVDSGFIDNRDCQFLSKP